MPHTALRVGLIGAGRAGTVVARALERVGHPCVAVHAVSEESRRRAAQLLPSADVRDPVEVCAAADLIIVAVPDDAIEPLVQGLAAGGAIRPAHMVMHLAGRYGTEVLAAAAQQGATTMAVHPAMTLQGRPEDVERLLHCPFAVTAEGDGEAIATALVLEMGGTPVSVAAKDRVLYHAALAHASNHLVTLEAQAMEMLRSIGIADAGAFLRPLTTASLDNALSRGDAALTGPVVRGDTATVVAHIAAIAGSDLPASSLEAYGAMSKATAARLSRGPSR